MRMVSKISPVSDSSLYVLTSRDNRKLNFICFYNILGVALISISNRGIICTGTIQLPVQGRRDKDCIIMSSKSKHWKHPSNLLKRKQIGRIKG